MASYQDLAPLINSVLNILLLYLLEYRYKSHSCISRTPTLELKIGTKLFRALFTLSKSEQ